MKRQDGLLLAISAILTSLLMSIIIHSPWNSPNLYSDIVDSFWGRCWVQSGALPYVGSSPGCSTSFEYPVLSGFLLYFVKLVGVTLEGYYVTFSILSLATGVVLVAACYGITRRLGRTLDPLYFVMPSFLIYGLYNFDLFHAMLAIVSLFFFLRGNKLASASFLGLAVDLKLTSVVLLPIFLMELKGTRDRLRYLVTFAALVAAFNLPIILLNFSNFLAGYQFIGNWGLEDAWYVWIFQNPATWDYAKIFALGLAGLLLLRVYTMKAGILTKSFLAIAVYLLSTYIYAPQFNLFLIPFIAVLEMKHPALYPWDGFNALIILTWFVPLSSPTLPWNWPQLFALLRAGCLAWMCMTVSASEGHSLGAWLESNWRRIAVAAVAAFLALPFVYFIAHGVGFYDTIQSVYGVFGLVSAAADAMLIAGYCLSKLWKPSKRAESIAAIIFSVLFASAATACFLFLYGVLVAPVSQFVTFSPLMLQYGYLVASFYGAAALLLLQRGLRGLMPAHPGDLGQRRLSEFLPETGPVADSGPQTEGTASGTS